MWDFLNSEAWWMETLLSTAWNVLGVIIAAVLTTFATIVVTEKRAHTKQDELHIELRGGHDVLQTEHGTIQNVLQAEHGTIQSVLQAEHEMLNQNIDKSCAMISKDVTNIGGWVNDVRSTVLSVDTLLKDQVRDQKAAHDNLDKSQSKIMESVDHIKNLGQELERLNSENAELKQEIQRLLIKISENERLFSESKFKAQSEVENLRMMNKGLTAILMQNGQNSQNENASENDEWELEQ